MLALQHIPLQGCACHKPQLGSDTSTSKRAAWIGAIGLGLSAALMVAIGFHKPPARPARRRRA